MSPAPSRLDLRELAKHGRCLIHSSLNSPEDCLLQRGRALSIAFAANPCASANCACRAGDALGFGAWDFPEVWSLKVGVFDSAQSGAECPNSDHVA